MNGDTEAEAVTGVEIFCGILDIMDFRAATGNTTALPKLLRHKAKWRLQRPKYRL